MTGLALLQTRMAASPFSGNKANVTAGKLSLKNVRLETGFEYEGDEVIGGGVIDYRSVL